MVPVEVEVNSEPGLYCPHDSLHFGLLTPHDPPATLTLMLLNSAHKHIHIQVCIWHLACGHSSIVSCIEYCT